MSRRLVCAVLLVVALGSPAARANVLEGVGVGADAIAGANARTAWGSDAMATFSNPALLALSTHVSVGFGYQATLPALHIDRDLPVCEQGPEACAALHPGGYSPYRSYEPGAMQGVSVGFTIPLRMGWAGDGAIGVLFYFPTDHFAKVENLNFEYPHYLVHQYNANRLAMDLAFSVRPVRWLSLGIGGQILTDVHGRQALDVDPVNQVFVHQDTRVRADPKIAAVAGVAVLPDEHWTIGASFRDALFLGFYLPSVIILDGMANLDMAYAVESAYTPRRLNLGLSYRFAAGATLAAQGSWSLWSHMPIPSPPTNVDLNGQLVESVGFGSAFDIDSRETWPDGALRDTFGVALAGSLPLLDWLSLSGGYQWQQAITADETIPFRYLDNDQHSLSYGVRAAWWLDEPFFLTLSLSVGGATTWLPERRSERPAGDPTGSLGHGGWMQTLGVSLGLDYVPEDRRAESPVVSSGRPDPL